MLPLVEELNFIGGVEAYFVETDPLPESLKKGGFSNYEDDHSIIRTWKGREYWNTAMELALDSDVMIIGSSSPKVFVQKRLAKGLLTFEYSERPLKRGWLNYLSPTNMRNQYYYHLVLGNKPLYMLCYSAFTALDEYKMHSFRGRCYKFGYLPRIENVDVDKYLKFKRQEGKIKMVWCARFIKWKHPELPVLLAMKLVNDGYDFEINMIGSGVLFEKTKKLILKNNLQNHVHLLGNYPNKEVLKIMRMHDVFLFTSDKREGWGVVLNEAMGQVCCPVASNLIGATPYLLSHKKNGMIFESENLESLYGSVKYLLDNPTLMKEYALNAYHTVFEMWNPKFVAERFCNLCNALLSGSVTPYESGPCSLAAPTDCNISFE